MKHMFSTAALLLTILASQTSAQTVTTAPAEPDGMVQLFNGEDLSGWDGDPELWSVKDGVIRGETTPEKKANGNTFLIWQDGTTADFELRFTFRCTDQNNSGVQYRSKHITDGKPKNKWVVRGYQHEIRNENKFPNISGFIYGEGLGRNRICLVGEKAIMKDDKKEVTDTLISEKEYVELFKLDEWNEVIIRAEDRHIQHFMNGRLILDFTDSPELALTEGVLALQLHAGKPMWAEFKDIRIKELK